MNEIAFEAVSRHIKPGMTVFVNSNCGIPQELMRALVRLVDDQAFRTNPVTILMLLSVGVEGGDYLAPDVTGLRLKTAFTGAYAREAMAEGRADYLPWRLFHAPRLFLRHFRPDVALVQLSEKDHRGVHSLGVEVACKRVIDATPVVIAEVNSQMPYIFGDTRIGNSRLSEVVPVDYQVHQMGTDANGPETQRIARNVAELAPIPIWMVA